MLTTWHATGDAPRSPHRVAPGQEVAIWAGTWPAEPGQMVQVKWERRRGSELERGVAPAAWQRNAGPNSHWRARLGPFRRGDQVAYRVEASSSRGERATHDGGTFRVGPVVDLALLWHHHQPSYADPEHPEPRGRFRQPWVRLHAARDYFGMAWIASRYPELRLTFNLTPVLLEQIDDTVSNGLTDRAYELTARRAESLTQVEREAILAGFFDADWHHQILVHPRYAELLAMRSEGRSFAADDLRDLQMWFNLAWFGPELGAAEGVELPSGAHVSVRRWLEKGRGFHHGDVEEMLAVQRELLAAVVPLHRQLAARGQIELSTTPHDHPILPLLIDTDRATIDRPGASRPPRFAWPEDAVAHVRLAVASHQRRFGAVPAGMWPAEGAVAPFMISMLARHGVRWTASDAGVLARSGRWGYQVDDPDVLCRPYRVAEGDDALAMFFRHTSLSDAIGFRYARIPAEAAARSFVQEIEEELASRLGHDEPRVVTVALDGENAWGSYSDAGRPFLHALYGALRSSETIRTVTFRQVLDGDPERGVPAQPVESLPLADPLFTGSWIDESGTPGGADLGTWIGEPEENRAWELLGDARHQLADAGATEASHPEAFRAVRRAEASDWFWWYGQDQDSGRDDEFDALFRAHLRAAYRAIGGADPRLDRPIVARRRVWRFTAPIHSIRSGDRLVVRTNCPGSLEWRWTPGGAPERSMLHPVGGVMGGPRRHEIELPLVDGFAAGLDFRFRCEDPDCDGSHPCCKGEWARVEVEAS